MKVMKFFTIAAFLAFTLLVPDCKAQRSELKIEGSIVMYDSSPPRAGALNTAGGTSTYIVKISKIISGLESSDYILMITGHTFSKFSGIHWSESILSKKPLNFPIEKTLYNKSCRGICSLTIKASQAVKFSGGKRFKDNFQ